MISSDLHLKRGGAPIDHGFNHHSRSTCERKESAGVASSFWPVVPALRARNNDAVRRIVADPAAHRAYLLCASLIESVPKRAAVAA